jgi:hypothetical protein
MAYTTTNGNGTIYYTTNDRTPAEKRQLVKIFSISIAVPFVIAVMASFLA